MNIRHTLVCATLTMLCISYQACATIAKFSLVPTTPTVVTVPANNTILVQYTVTNQTKNTRTLTMVPVKGITQVSDQSGYCANPFTLGAQDSCLLTLSLDGSQLSSAVQAGPQICKTIHNTNQPDLLLCSQPSTQNALSVYVTSAVPNTNQAVYVSNWDADSISLCFANALTGALENCNITAIGGTLSKPEAIGTNASVSMLYVANVGGGVSLCQINSQTGALSACHATGSGFASPDGVVLNSSGTLAYISNIIDNSVSRCQVDSDTGELDGCTSSLHDFSTPSDIAISPDGTYVYVGNFTGNSVSSCLLNSGTGEIDSCVISSGFVAGPEGVFINATGLLAYVTNKDSGTVSMCAVTSGVINSCRATGGTFAGFGNLALNAAGTLAYVPSSSSAVSVCAVDSVTGELSGCVDSTGTGFTGPSGVLLTTLPL